MSKVKAYYILLVESFTFTDIKDSLLKPTSIYSIIKCAAGWLEHMCSSV